MVYAEIRRLEQFLHQNDLRTLRGSSTNDAFGSRQIGSTVPGTGELCGGNGKVTGHGRGLRKNWRHGNG